MKCENMRAEGKDCGLLKNEMKPVAQTKVERNN